MWGEIKTGKKQRLEVSEKKILVKKKKKSGILYVLSVWEVRWGAHEWLGGVHKRFGGGCTQEVWGVCVHKRFGGVYTRGWSGKCASERETLKISNTVYSVLETRPIIFFFFMNYSFCSKLDRIKCYFII